MKQPIDKPTLIEVLNAQSGKIFLNFMNEFWLILCFDSSWYPKFKLLEWISYLFGESVRSVLVPFEGFALSHWFRVSFTAFWWVFKFFFVLLEKTIFGTDWKDTIELCKKMNHWVRKIQCRFKHWKLCCGTRSTWRTLIWMKRLSRSELFLLVSWWTCLKSFPISKSFFLCRWSEKIDDQLLQLCPGAERQFHFHNRVVWSLNRILSNRGTHPQN